MKTQEIINSLITIKNEDNKEIIGNAMQRLAELQNKLNTKNKNL